VVVKFPGIVRISLGSGSGRTRTKGSERRKKRVSSSVIGVPAIANQTLRDGSVSGLTVSVKIKWNKNKDVGPVLGQAR